MTTRRWTIRTLWVGDSLSTIERLALASFVYHQHDVELYTYNEVKGVPDGVTVRDANRILDGSLIFTYKSRPSYAAFANWFRYRLLHEHGGIWIDTDVVCLKPFEFSGPLIAGREEYGRVNCAVLGGEPGHPLFAALAQQCENPNDFLPYDTPKQKRRKVFRRYLQGNQRGNLKWGETGPGGLTSAMQHTGLFDIALPVTAFYPVHSRCWDTIFDLTYPDPAKFFPESYAIHLWNEMIRRNPDYGKDKTYEHGSLIEALKRQYL
ncbi:MAG: hypothetical protein HKN56_09840 [Gammaproteobacteria bacterium]|nr:hypothetical protein [Gammaproteobacteria bacterium]